jgi:hypothetical protein
MKLDPGIHIAMHSVLSLKPGVTVLDHKLDAQNMHGQGYDGASNMRGEWKGLLAKFVQECPHAYYIHDFAHQLQLALK